MTFPQQPQQPQYPQYPQGPAPQYPQSQFPQQLQQPNRNPFFEWLQRAKRDFSRIGASLCLMVIIWYAGVFLLKGVVRAVAGGVGAGGDMPNWMTFLISDVPLYLIAMPVAVVLMGKSTVIETRKFNMKPGMFFKLLLMCLPMMWVGSMVGSMLSLGLSDGEYTVDVTLSGGSGRASVQSPAKLTVSGGAASAEIVWSSSNYDYMRIGEEKFLPVNTEGNSTFVIPVSCFDREITVYADTIAMSEPHEIEYRLTFDSASVK